MKIQITSFSWRIASVVVVILIAFIGCEQGTDSQPVTQKKDQPKIAAPPTVGGDAGSDKATQQEPAVDPNEKEAKVGVGKKGKSYGGGVISEPASQYWKVQEKVAFMMVKKNEDLYKATNGRLPKTHEEYVKAVLTGVKLPDLDEGLEYHYDAEKQTLMVRSIPE